MAGVVVVAHPLVQHKLTLMRRKDTPAAEFRRLLRETGALIVCEMLRDAPTRLDIIETPLAPMRAPVLDGPEVCFVSVLRAGNGLLDGALDILPSARAGHIGLYRDPKTLRPVEYYFKVPEDIAVRPVIVLDPMLATGHSLAAAVTRLKGAGAHRIRVAALLAAPEGLAVFGERHPDVPVTLAAIDSHLDMHAYIVPGLGDAGDRLYGTR